MEAYSGFGFAADMSSISEDGFEIIQDVSVEKYFTLETTHELRAECKDLPYCAGLRNACNDDLVSDRCPVTCGKCHPFAQPVVEIEPNCDDLQSYCPSLRSQCETDTIARTCARTCGYCQDKTYTGIMQHLHITNMCFDQPGCDELPIARCTDTRTGHNVQTKCPIRCGLCEPEKEIELNVCVDTVDTCALLTNGCSEVHVAAHCAKTCNKCPTITAECDDSNIHCHMWRSNCQHPFVNMACPATCGICD